MDENKDRRFSDNPKKIMFRMRMSEDILKLLDELCKKYKLNRSEMIRKLIKDSTK